MSSDPADMPDTVKLALAMLRLRATVLRLGMAAKAAQTLNQQRAAQRAQVLTEMMQQHDRLDA